MRILTKNKLSENKHMTSEGYMVCADAILARTGEQTYTLDELFGNGESDSVDVLRIPEEVFSDKTIASFENKPITIEHPETFVDAENHNELSVGFVRDVVKKKIDGNDFLVGNLIITNKEAINLVNDGKKFLSCGYECDVVEENGKYIQKNIRGNHVALCDVPRAGNTMIQDSRLHGITVYKDCSVFELKKGYLIENQGKLVSIEDSLEDSKKLIDILKEGE